MNEILAVTGLSGKKSGGGIAQILSAHKDEVLAKFPGGVRALVRSTSDTSKLDATALGFEKQYGELADSVYLEQAFRDVDTVLHIASISLTTYIVDAAVRCHVRRLICVHTTGIYSKYKEAGEVYRIIDAYVEQKCQDNNIELTILRPTMIYGNISDNNVVKFIKMVDRLPLMPVVNGARYALQPVHYLDLSEAYYQVLMNENTANHNYILSGGEPINLRDMLLEIGNCLGKKVHFISCPYPVAYAGAWLLYLMSLKKIDYREKVQRLCEPRVYSHDDAKRDFGYCPKKFNIGIVDEVEKYKAHRN